MSTVKVELDESLAALLRQTNQSAQDAAREMIVLARIIREKGLRIMRAKWKALCLGSRNG